MLLGQKTIRILLILISQTLLGQNPAVVQLTPPTINAHTILKTITCTRPMREGCFNISFESLCGKTVIHCYGHGGSGWTTLFGSIEKAIELFEELPKKNSHTPIRVIGSGCMGLTAAIELTKKGYTVAGITTKELYDTPSWTAAGYFGLVSLQTSPEEQDQVTELGIRTFATYQLIEQANHPYLTKETVRYLPVYCSKETDSGIEGLEQRGYIPSHEEVTLDFGNGVCHRNMIKYMTYFMDTTKLMQQLLGEVHRLQIPIELQEVHSFEDLQEEIIFNCSGLGGRDLNRDSRIIPVRGHLILLDNQPNTTHMEYNMIYTKVHWQDREEYVYLFPKGMSITADHIEGLPCQGVLGGSFVLGTDQLSPIQLIELDELEFKNLLERNSLFFHGIPYQGTCKSTKIPDFIFLP